MFLFFKKVIRYIKIYGIYFTWFKLAGRLRLRFRFLRPRYRRNILDVGVIGCGHFAFSTLGYSLSSFYSTRFVDCYDINLLAQQSFANFYRIQNPSTSVKDLLSNDRVRYVYITANHASHTDYAIQALKAGKIVYIEKPIAVNWDQFKRLIFAVERYQQPTYAGYNRPFSPAIRMLRTYVKEQTSPITLNCFISGHHLPPDHWYRDPAEGTRICGNVGHWLDLAVHILTWRGLPDLWKISVAYSSDTLRDDNLSISMTSKEGDLVVIIITSRSEPFEGINESINFQQADTICKIDDFRKMTIWRDSDVAHYRYWPKNVGLNRALLQPFLSNETRNWDEVIKSTLLMLTISDMVRSGQEYISFSFNDSFKRLEDSTLCSSLIKNII